MIFEAVTRTSVGRQPLKDSSLFDVTVMLSAVTELTFISQPEVELSF